MLRTLLLIGSGATALLAAASIAQAGVVVSSVPGSVSALSGFQSAAPGSTYINFNDVLGPYPANSPISSDGYTFNGSGIVVNGTTGIYAAPAGDTSNYLSTGSFGSGTNVESVSFGQSYTKFGLYWGSVDHYNTLELLNGASVVYSLAGVDIPSPANGDQASDLTNLYVNIAFNGGQSFNGARFVNMGQPAFEVDNIAVAGAVPEPATWAMMILGFAGIGYLMHRRKQKGSLSLDPGPLAA